MKKIITLFNEDRIWAGIFKWIVVYLLFTVVTTVGSFDIHTSWLERFSKSLLWPFQLIKILLSA